MHSFNFVEAIAEITINLQIPGDVIHLLGYYPPIPTTTTERPRPIKPYYTYPKPAKPSTTSTTSFNQHNQQSHGPTSWEHETNHISFYPLVHPDEHFGIADEDGFGSEAEAAVFSHNNYGDFSNKPTTYADNEYHPFQGTFTPYFFFPNRLLLFSPSLAPCKTLL